MVFLFYRVLHVLPISIFSKASGVVGLTTIFGFFRSYVPRISNRVRPQLRFICSGRGPSFHAQFYRRPMGGFRKATSYRLRAIGCGRGQPMFHRFFRRNGSNFYRTPLLVFRFVWRRPFFPFTSAVFVMPWGREPIRFVDSTFTRGDFGVSLCGFTRRIASGIRGEHVYPKRYLVLRFAANGGGIVIFLVAFFVLRPKREGIVIVTYRGGILFYISSSIVCLFCGAVGVLFGRNSGPLFRVRGPN